MDGEFRPCLAIGILKPIAEGLIEMKVKFKIERCTFDLVLSVWKDHLWPDRKTSIEPYSVLKLNGGFDMDYKNREVYFFSAKKIFDNTKSVETNTTNDKQEIIGVVSGHQTVASEFRLRGLYVFEKYRKQGVASALVKEVESTAYLLKSRLIWTLPRKNNLIFYQKNGFKQVTDWSDEYEFGPNCVATKEL